MPQDAGNHGTIGPNEKRKDRYFALVIFANKSGFVLGPTDRETACLAFHHYAIPGARIIVSNRPLEMFDLNAVTVDIPNRTN